MDFAADAVTEFIAPPPARPPTAKPAADTFGPSFDDHLQAEQDARASRAKDARDARDAARADQADRAADRADGRADNADPVHEAAASDDRDDASETPASEQPIHEEPGPDATHAAQTPAPLLVQLIATSEPQTSPTQTPVQATPATTAAAAPPEGPAIVAETTLAAPNALNAGKKAPVRDVNAKSAKAEAVSATPEATAPQTETVAALVQSSAPQTPTLQGNADADKVTAPIATSPGHDGPARAPKADTDAKGAAPTQSAPVRPDDAERAPAPAANAAKAATAARATVAAAQAADAPASTPLSASNAPPAAASLQMPVSTQYVAAAADASGLRAAPVAAQVGHEIVRRFDGGNAKFDIRLDPPELGRVDVRLEVSRDQRVTATISADNPQALHELARHARDLEQTLQSAGLELSDKGLSFDLRQDSDGRAQADTDSGAPPSPGARNDNATTEQTPIARPRLEGWRGVRVDMMV